MPDISFSIAGRSYTLRCAPGQEPRLRAAAAALSERLAEHAQRMATADDRLLLVVAALDLLDRLGGAEAQTAAARAEAADLRAWAGTLAARLETTAGTLATHAADSLAGVGEDA
jgi:cell division protein ZapA